MTALVPNACPAVGLLLLLAYTAGSTKPAPTVFTTYDTLKLADGIYRLRPGGGASVFVSGNSVPIFGFDGALVVNSGQWPGVAIVSMPGTRFELTPPVNHAFLSSLRTKCHDEPS